MTTWAEPITLASVPPTTALAQLADIILEGRLEATLTGWRDAGASWDDIARKLWMATDQRVSVTGPTVQAWTEALLAPEPTEVPR